MSASPPSFKGTSTQQPGHYRSRRYARQLALQLLFQWEFHQSQGQWVEEFWARQTVPQKTREFSDQLVQGVVTKQADLDHLISRYAVDWTLERMPVVDRNILRCAIFELLWMEDVPAKVTVNEALELAKRFADDETKRFVNGMLDHILQEDPRLQRKRAEMTNQEHGKLSDTTFLPSASNST